MKPLRPTHCTKSDFCDWGLFSYLKMWKPIKIFEYSFKLLTYLYYFKL